MLPSVKGLIATLDLRYKAMVLVLKLKFDPILPRQFCTAD